MIHTMRERGPNLETESLIDGRARCAFGLASRFGGVRGPGWRAERWGGRGFLEVWSPIAITAPLDVRTHPTRGTYFEAQCNRRVRGRNQVHGEQHRLWLDGSVEYTIAWDSLDDVPDDGIVDLNLDFSGDLTWYKQPSSTDCEGSYAVYGSTAGRFVDRAGNELMNYETGKFCHVLRPVLVDATGARFPCDQTAPLPNPNRLRVILPMDWVSSSAFPLTLDPTFGYTSVGGSSFGISAGVTTAFVASGYRRTAGAGETITSVSCYCQSTASMRFGAYSVVSGAASAPLGYGNPADNSTAGWQTATPASPLAMVEGTIYGPAFYSGTSGPKNFYYDYKGGTITYDRVATWPNPYGTPDNLGPSAYSLYATYEVASGHPAIRRFGGVPYAAVNRGVW